MGKFIYEGSIKVDFDDRVLAHLQLVIGSKLRRESLAIEIGVDPALGFERGLP